MPRQDDPTLTGEISLLRRIPPWGGRVDWDENGRPIASSQNFKDKDDELSAFIESETTFDEVLAGHQGFGLVRFTADQVRQIAGAAVIICRDALENGPAGHVLICGKLTGGMRTKLKAKATWVDGRWPQRIDPITGEPV
jgi:hypothetical protein